ncbi:MAG: hypothetical protein K0M69_15920 [Youngiibacter sp.]|nr:hypothetical protein [Youngiibacter sp.]
MTVLESDAMRQELLLKHLNHRLMFCEDGIEESYLREEIEKIEAKRLDHNSDNRSNSAPVGVHVPLEVRSDDGDVAFIRKVLVDITDVNSELDPIEQLEWETSYDPIKNWYWLWIQTRGKDFVIWQTGDDKSAALEKIRGYEPCIS